MSMIPEDPFAGRVSSVLWYLGRWRPVMAEGAGTLTIDVPEYTQRNVVVDDHSKTGSSLSIDILDWPFLRGHTLSQVSGICVRHLAVLGVIFRNGPTGVTGISQALGCSKVLVSQAFSKLSTLGLVELVTEPTRDNRSRPHGIRLRVLDGIIEDLVAVYRRGSAAKLHTLTTRK